MNRIVTAVCIAVTASAFAQTGAGEGQATQPSTTQQGSSSTQKSRPGVGTSRQGTGNMGNSEPGTLQGKGEDKTTQDKYGQMNKEPMGGATTTDITKIGAASRKPSDEREAKREIEQIYKAEDQAMKDHDFDAKLSHLDFPIFMATDDSRGMAEGKMVTKEEYTSMMKPHFDAMKDAKKTHNPTITVLSDNLATVVDSFTITSGKQKVTGKSTALLVKTNGQWKIKSLIEAGWGDVQKEKPGA